MTDSHSDDQIIADAFKRSLWVMVVLILIAGAMWWWLRSDPNTEIDGEDAALIEARTVSLGSQAQPPVVNFSDITATSGITHQHRNGAYGERLLPEAMGGGVAVLDYNNDGALDLLFVSGQPWPWRKHQSAHSSLVLYQGDGSGRFVDVTQHADLESSLYGMGVAVGDYDNDGQVDIFVTAVGKNQLYRNLGNGKFGNVTAEARVDGDDQAWSTGAAFVDYDRDGDLDLLVLNYVQWSREIDLQANYQLTGLGRAYGPPAQFAGTQSYLYRNEGNGRFTDVSEASGIYVVNPATGVAVGKGLAVLPADVDQDGWVDLVVANDMVRNFLFKNQEGNHFIEQGVASGVAFDNTGSATGAMGIDDVQFSEVDEYAIGIGNFGNEMSSVYVRGENSDLFTDQAIVTGIGPPSRRAVTFGLLFFDYDLDGRNDLFQANGHIEPEINVVESSQHYAQLPQLFWNCGMQCARQFVLVKAEGRNDLGQPLVGRGAAYGDFDNDGDLDLVVTQIGGAPKLLRNDQQSNHHWLQLDLRTSQGAPALGANVLVVADGRQQYARLETTRSYLSQVTPILNFGLGELNEVQTVQINWLNGQTTVLENPSVNQRITLTEP